MMNEVFQDAPHNTPLSAEERIGLIPSIATKAELNQLERIGIDAARRWSHRGVVLRRPDLLSDAFARQLHRRMFSEVWGWAGKYRQSEKNLGWDWHRIPEGVRVAMDDAQYWDAHQTYPVFEAAVRLHHKLVIIHPWPNGNGRHARLLADIWCAARGVVEPTWGANQNLQADGPVREQYLAAMRAADFEDFGPIFRFARS